MTGVRRIILLIALAVIGATARPPVATSQPAQATHVADHPLKIWAVLASEDVRKSGLDDLIMRGMAADKMILVDRQRLDLVATELSFIQMAQPDGSADRSRVGHVLKADALVVVTKQSAEGKDFIRVVICDTHSGARLADDYMALEEGKLETTAKEALASISRVRQRFPSGVQRIFGVPPFVSRNLTHEYDHLQRGFASLLTHALSAQEGVAVIEVEEARQIAREASLADDNGIERIVPLFVEGEFTVNRVGPEGPFTVTFQVCIAGSGGKAQKLPDRTVELNAAAGYVRGEVAALLTGAEHGNPLNAAEQSAALTERADAFALLGGWEHSTGLREAALFLKDDAVQREKLIREYCRIVTAGWPRGTVLGSEWHLARVHERSELWHAALAHIEYVIRNRQATQSDALALADRVLYSALELRKTPNDAVPPLEQAKRRFLREVYPLTLGLAPARAGTEWADLLIRYATLNYESNEGRPGDGDFLFEILTEVLPADAQPPNNLVLMMYNFTGDHPKGTIPPFLEKLAKCSRPVCRILGRYAILNRRWVKERKQLDLQAFEREVEQLEADWQGLQPTLQKPDTSNPLLSSHIKDLRLRVAFALRPPPPHPEIPSPKKVFAVDAEPINLTVRTLAGEIVSAHDKRWRQVGGWGGMQHLFRCGDDTDVLWQGGAVAVMRQEGAIQEILVDPTAWITDVKWDGRNLWVASRYAGLRVISLDGTLVARIGEKDGLPPGDRAMLVRPIEPGRALIAGALGEDHRLWLALVRHDGPRGQAEVIHKAMGQVGPQDAPDLYGKTTPLWTHMLEPADKTSPCVVLIGRDGKPNRPLQVDLSTKKVTLYPRKLSWNRQDDSYFSHAGRLYEAGQDAQLLRYGDQLYETGMGVWYRVDLDAGKRTEMGRLPGGLFAFGVSAHYGIVAWGPEGFFRVTPRTNDPAAATQERD